MKKWLTHVYRMLCFFMSKTQGIIRFQDGSIETSGISERPGSIYDKTQRIKCLSEYLCKYTQANIKKLKGQANFVKPI